MRGNSPLLDLLSQLANPMQGAHNAPSAGYRPPPVSAGDYLANPGSFPSVDGARPSLFDQPPPAMARRPMGEPVPRSVPIGPGGVTGGAPASPESMQRYQRLRASTGQWGADAGQLAAESRFSPRYSRPDPHTEETRAQFGGRMPAIGPGGVVSPSASARAAEETGVSERYLDTLIQHESGGNNRARAQTSSATGPAQFIDSTWLSVMRRYGRDYGLPANASDAEILGLRTHPNWAALMAGEYTQENRRQMQRALGRPISEGEGYLGHFLGPDDAVDLLSAAEAGMSDARRFVSPAAVEANRSVFYHRDGRPRSAREVVQLQTNGRGFRGDRLGDRGS